MIENTQHRDPLLHLALSLNDPSRYITELESAGQSQLVNSECLPSEGSEHYASIGITILGTLDGDPMFVRAQLPDGWVKRPTDHSMWSEVIDQHGRKRVTVFYKAAFYDRKAFGRVVDVRSYVFEAVDSGAPIVTDDGWATPTAIVEAASQLIDAERKSVALAASRAGDEEYWDGRKAEMLASIDKYQAVVAQFTADSEGPK